MKDDGLKDIEKLAAEVAQKALQADVDFNTQMAALKLLTPYYAVLKRIKKTDDEGDHTVPTMGDLQRRLQIVGNSNG